jgi:hypothetical protein
MRTSQSPRPGDTTPTPAGPAPSARVRPLPSGRFRVFVCLGPHPGTGKPIRLSRTFATEREAIIVRDAMLEEQPNFLARLRQQLRATNLSAKPSGRHPVLALDEAGMEFVLQLVLASGSLKALAGSHGVSYPTIRSRLDRLIERLQEILADWEADPMAERLADLVEKGEILAPTARALLELHQRDLKRLEGRKT